MKPLTILTMSLCAGVLAFTLPATADAQDRGERAERREQALEGRDERRREAREGRREVRDDRRDDRREDRRTGREDRREVRDDRRDDRRDYRHDRRDDRRDYRHDRRDHWRDHRRDNRHIYRSGHGHRHIVRRHYRENDNLRIYVSPYNVFSLSYGSRHYPDHVRYHVPSYFRFMAQPGRCHLVTDEEWFYDRWAVVTFEICYDRFGEAWRTRGSTRLRYYLD